MQVKQEKQARECMSTTFRPYIGRAAKMTGTAEPRIDMKDKGTPTASCVIPYAILVGPDTPESERITSPMKCDRAAASPQLCERSGARILSIGADIPQFHGRRSTVVGMYMSYEPFV